VNVNVPAGYIDPGPLPNSATDIDAPWIGTSPDGNYIDLPAGSQLTLGINLVANGDPGPDLVYYELLNSGSPDYILLDWVRIEISDGSSWYTIFDWGDGARDINTNVDFNLLPPLAPPEPDQRSIDSTLPLYNNSGVAIDIDSIVGPGTYTSLRFTSSPYGGGVDGDTDIDAVEVLP
jgi:hypothetical protein